ncbi:THUMP domain-containing protein 2 [Ornithorhynchus anatinus]|nr:THUMP domain-containing protein 2 [Ornithorhynchus anatinus]XP_028922760.1 THUMP domain-containing protein 2 [Ornithorhynchus anatinus]XP_028922761.1 THUMP domain-containing protein 2 [Ornithorhynchus anatinus]XP_028922764.1 THUMP domain-containing protein 2 [Ornithorhynchus anatinus]
MQRLVTEDPRCWLDAVSVWKNLLGFDASEEKLPQGFKRKAGGSTSVITKKLKMEQTVGMPDLSECQPEEPKEGMEQEHQNPLTEEEDFPSERSENESAKGAGNDNDSPFTFRVSCRCSGAIARAFTSQEVGRVIGMTLIKQFAWKADLRNPDLEIFIHLNDMYSVVGIPVFRLPLASRTYIKTAGLRSTIAWAMASLAEINAGSLVLDPMCGLGTILLEAAKEWPDANYLGTDISNSQLQVARDNVNAAGLMDKIELLKVSVIELPFPSGRLDVIISDVPFGKKFTIGKDIESILQEMKRVLRVGGTVVLLLSEELHRHLKGCKESSSPSDSQGDRTSNIENGKYLNPEGKSRIPEITSSSPQDSELSGRDMASPLDRLVVEECYGVSLGKTEAFIHKYRKIHLSD